MEKSESGPGRPELVRAVTGDTKRRNWEDLWMGTRFCYLPLGIMFWSLMGCFVDASVGEWWKTVGGLCRTPHPCGCLGDLRGHV